MEHVLLAPARQDGFLESYEVERVRDGPEHGGYVTHPAPGDRGDSRSLARSAGRRRVGSGSRLAHGGGGGGAPAPGSTAGRGCRCSPRWRQALRIPFGGRARPVARGANDAPAAPDLAALSPDALVLLSPDGAVLAVNATAERMFGYRRDEVVGMHAIGLVHPDDLWEAADSLRTTQRVEGVYGSPSLLRLRRADGGYFTAEVQGANYAEDPSVRGVVISIRDVSERREVAEALANTEETFHAVVKHASEIILLLDADGRVQYSSQALTAMTGWRPEELLGNTTEHFVHPDDQPDLFAVTVPAFDVPGAQVTAEFRLLHRLGEVRHCDLLLVNLLDQPAVGRVALYVRDVTERKAAEEARAEVEERFVSAFQNAPIGMALQDLEGRFLLVNRALCNLVGYSAEYLLSATGDALTHPDDLPDQAALRQRVVSGEIAGYHFEKRFVRADGRVVWVKLSVSTVVGADGQPAYVVAHVEDISGARRDQERLTHQALHDILTGLPNRALLIDRMGHALDRAKRGAPPFAVLFCDLDRFKVVNDSLGHEVGDRLLVQCAERLQGVVRAGDTVARFGGDEFVVLCEDVHDKEEVHGVAERIGAALRSPFVLDDAEFVVSTSIGIAFSGSTRSCPQAR
ncbi:MAG: PAS domain S-box protein [Acidimicrobiia bacterium]|nr:PAS domain S-box protein [Acidimicrobiia bacterium]